MTLLYMVFSNNILQYFSKGDKRSIAAKRNIIVSLGLKGINIIISLALVPMTINYVSPVQYGLWLTISGMIVWLSYFDFGFTHGFRNRFTEAVAKGDDDKAKALVSTTYISMSILFVLICAVFLCINNFLHWSSILNISQEYDLELTKVFSAMAILFCYTFVARTLTTMFAADQKPALASSIDTIGQFLACITILILTHTTEGSLMKLALVFSGLPCLILTIATFFTFKTKRYKKYAPSLGYFRPEMIRSIVGLGGKFFLIMLAMFCIIQLMNLILTREQGAEAVTIYNITYKYFNIVHMVFMIVLTPFWSAFADAYAKEDYAWMQNMMKKLEMLFYLTLPIIVVLALVSPIVYKCWIGNSVSIPIEVTIGVGLYSYLSCAGSLYMFLINGTSKVYLQLLIYSFFAIISIPSMIFCCRLFGVVGIVIVPSLVYITQTVCGKLQLSRLINKTASGVWNK